MTTDRDDRDCAQPPPARVEDLLQLRKAYDRLQDEIAQSPDAYITSARKTIRDQLAKVIDRLGGTIRHHGGDDGEHRIDMIPGMPVIEGGFPPEILGPGWRDFPPPTIPPCVMNSIRANNSLTEQDNHWWQSWGKHFGYIAEKMFFPTSVDELAIAVSRAEQDSVPLRAIGGGWGFSDAVLPNGVFADRPFAVGVEPFAQLVPVTAVYPPDDSPVTVGVGLPTGGPPADRPGGIVLFNPFEEGADPDWAYAGGGAWTAINDAISQAVAGFDMDVRDFFGDVGVAEAFQHALGRGYFPMNPSGDGPGTLVIRTGRTGLDSQKYYLGGGKWIVGPLRRDARIVHVDEVLEDGVVFLPSTPELALSLLARPQRGYLINTQHMVSSLQQGFPEIATASALAHTDRHFFHVEAGITMSDLSKLLSHQSPRLAIEASGGSPGATLAGALATGTHGGELRKPLLVDRVKAVHLVGPGGVQWWIEGDTPIADPDKLMARYPCLSRDHIILGTDVQRGLTGQEWLNAVVVSMGTIGINYSMVLEVVPLFGIHEVTVEQSWAALLANGRFAGNPITPATLRANLDSASRNDLGDTILSICDGTLTGITPSENQYIDIAIDPNPTSAGGPRSWNCWVVNREFLPAVPFERKPLSAGGMGGVIASVIDRIDDPVIRDRLITMFLLDADMFNEILRMVKSPSSYLDPISLAILAGKIGHFIDQTLGDVDGAMAKVSRIASASDTIDAFLDVLTEPFQSSADFGAASAIVSGVFSGLFGIQNGRAETTNVASQVGAIGFPAEGIVGSAIEVGMSPGDAFPYIQREILDRISQPFFGYVSVRVCPQTQQFLGMQQFDRSVMVEVVAFSTHSARAFVDDLQRRTVALIKSGDLQATLHWGLECSQMDAEALSRIDAFNSGSPSKLEKFKIVRDTIHRRHESFDASLFSNRFSFRLGL